MNNKSRKHLPSLNSFATFEVAARHLSFTIAGQELNVTQGAISQNIKHLEQALGVEVFVRRHNALELTPFGAGLLAAVTQGLDAISHAVANVHGVEETKIITFSATVAVANHWLKPLIDQYTARNPEVRFVVLASDEDDSLRNHGNTDFSLICGSERCGAGDELLFLFPEAVKPVCSPKLLVDHQPFDNLDNLLSVKLLHLHQKHWSDAAIGWKPLTWEHWLKSAGHDDTNLLNSGFTSNNYSMLIDAAIRGEGVILGWQHIVQNGLVNGSLAVAHETGLLSQRGHFLKLNSSTRKSRVTMDFLDFIVEAHRGWRPWGASQIYQT